MTDITKRKTLTLPRMSRKELTAGLIFLAVYIFALPVLVPLIGKSVFPKAESATLTVVYYLISFIAVLALFKRYLLLNFRRLTRAPSRVFFTLVLSIAAYFVFTLAVSLFVSMFNGSVNPNDAGIAEEAATGRRAILASAILLGPLVEETLFRGAIFGTLVKKNRLLAYAVSYLVFASYHLWQYALADFSPALLLNLLDYLPASLALGICFEKSGTVWAPMFLHAAINAAALLTV